MLAFSQWRFVRFAANQKATTTMAMIAEALAAIGGVPAGVLADRMDCLKAGVVANVLVPTPDYVRFANHYGFRLDWRRPASKGIVEHLCYAQSDLVVPLLTEAKVTGQPVGLRAATTEQRFCALGEEAFLVGAAAIGNTRLPALMPRSTGAVLVPQPRIRA